MNAQSRACLVDNWTLESAAVLLDQGVEALRTQRRTAYRDALDETFASGTDRTGFAIDAFWGLDTYFGALANFLSAFLLFDRLAFARNGFEVAWQRFPTFSGQLGKLIDGLDEPPSFRAYEADLGSATTDAQVLFYLALAESLNCDVLLSPQRSALLRRSALTRAPTYGDYARDLIATLDSQLKSRLSALGSDLLCAQVAPNLEFPAVAGLVLSEAKQRSEILTAAIDLRESGPIRDLRRLLSECASDVRAGLVYARLVDTVPDAIRYALRNTGRIDPERSIGSVGFSAVFFSVEKDIGTPVASHLLFLRDLARCRLELQGAARHVDRLFDFTVEKG